MVKEYKIKQAKKFRQSEYVITSGDNNIAATLLLEGYEFRKATAFFANQTWKFKLGFFNAKISLKRTDKAQDATVINPKYYADGYKLQLGNKTYTLNINDSLNKITWLIETKDIIAQISFEGSFTFTTQANAQIKDSSLKDEDIMLLLCLGMFIYNQANKLFGR